MRGFNSSIEMGDLAEKSLSGTEDLHPISPQQIEKRTSLEITPPRSFLSPITEKFGCKCMLSSVKIALLSNRLNLLIPCGSLAILVDKLTNHHGWVFFLSFLGIIALSERFEWATGQLDTGTTGLLFYLDLCSPINFPEFLSSIRIVLFRKTFKSGIIA